MKNTITPYGLRISDEMKNFVRNEAFNNRRSMNKQIEFWIQEKMDLRECANKKVASQES